MGGDCIDYPWDKSTPTANLTTAKLIFNSTISTHGTSFYGIDLANFTFWLGGQIKFSITYIHTQINTTSYVGIKLSNPNKMATSMLVTPMPFCSPPTPTPLTHQHGQADPMITLSDAAISSQASRASIQLPSLLSSLPPHHCCPQTNCAVQIRTTIDRLPTTFANLNFV
jgi:hypothetical protein